MSTFTLLVLLAALASTLVLVLFSLRGRDLDDPADRPSTLSRFLLVALRLVIGWHFFIEAAEKVHDPSWSAEGYLRESTGPLAPHFRDMAGDRAIEQVTLTSAGDISAELDLRLQTYLDEFVNFYRLNAEQKKLAEAKIDQIKAEAKRWFSERSRKVRLITAAPEAPPVFKDLTMPERLKMHEEFKRQVEQIEAKDLGQYSDAADEWKTAKDNAAKWRGTIKRDLDLLHKEMKRSLRTLLLGIAKQDLPVEAQAKLENDLQKAAKKREDDEKKKKGLKPADEEWEAVDAYQHKADEEDLVLYRSAFSDVYHAGQRDKLDEQTRRIVQYTIDKKQAPATSYDILPYTPGRPLGSWELLDWSNLLVKWGLLVVGLCLLLGLLTRLACLAGAVYLLLFYLAMPALPGWPPSPRAEGHYLFINKNIIEMVALLALATLRTGRWAGLDGLIDVFTRRRNAAPEETQTHGSAGEGV